MLQLRPSCEHCERPLPPDSLAARICSFECTFCDTCTDSLLGGVCPNCTGELVARPVRPSALLEGAPPSQEPVHSPVDLEAHAATRANRPVDEDHAGVVLRRYIDAWSTGDLSTLLEQYDPGFTLTYDGAHRFAGAHVGRDDAVAVMAEVSTLAPRTLVSIDEVLVGDRAGALVVTERLERDGERAEVQRTLLYRVDRGRLTSCILLEHDRATVDRCWR